MKYAYKNVSCVTKTFHGVTFQPGESKSVDRFINDSSMIRTTINNVSKKDSASKSSKPSKIVISETQQEVDKIESENKEEQSDGTDKHQ